MKNINGNRFFICKLFCFSFCCLLFVFPIMHFDTLTTNAAQIPGIIPDGFYYIQNEYYGRYMTVHSTSSNTIEENANIYEYGIPVNQNDRGKQLFRFQYNSSYDCYYIYAVCKGDMSQLIYPGEHSVVSIDWGTDYTVNSGDNINLQTQGNYSRQRWKITTSGTYQALICPYGCSDLAITCYGDYNGTSSGTSSTSQGNIYVGYNSSNFSKYWKLIPYTGNHPLAEGVYRFRNINTGKYLATTSSSPSSGGSVTQSTGSNSNAQKFRLSLYDNQYCTLSPLSNTSLNLSADPTANGNLLTVETASNSPFQQFRVTNNGSNYYLTTKYSLCRVVSQSSNNSLQIVIRDNTGSAEQKWIAEPVSIDDPYASLNWRYPFNRINIFNRITCGYKTPGHLDHAGIDLVADIYLTYINAVTTNGTRLYSPYSGIVVDSSAGTSGNTNRGHYVTVLTNCIDPTNGNNILVSFYHLKQAPSLTIDDAVSAGSLIGYVGNTGYSTGSHLHLTMGNGNGNFITSSTSINPQRFFPAVCFTNDISNVTP